MTIQLNGNLSYYVEIIDNRLQSSYESPDIIPRILLVLKPNTRLFFYMKAIRHERLDQKHKPCEASDDHSFIKCLEEFTMRQAGCQPPWRRFSVVELPLCDVWTLLSNYIVTIMKTFQLWSEKRLLRLQNANPRVL